jgi:3-hydroxyisobutyrate dehydrogenase-like beta-hydroxyacid dehydrogenase
MSASENQHGRQESIGLIGLGLMGSAAAERLLSGGFAVVGFDIDADKCADLRSLGGSVATSPKEAVEAVSRVVLSLPDSAVVREVVEGSDGILQAAKPPRYVMDTTTGDPEETIRMAECLAARGIEMLDATVSGSSRQFRDGEAVLMVGGDRAAFEACTDVFGVLSEKVFYLGPSGGGSKAKLASNLILGLNRLALAEGLVFADVLGLDLAGFLELLKISPAYSAAMDTKGRKMLKDDFTPQARLRQHRKDVSLILAYARRADQELPLSQAHLEILDRAIAAGDGDLDNAAVIREIARRRRAQPPADESESATE